MWMFRHAYYKGKLLREITNSHMTNIIIVTWQNTTKKGKLLREITKGNP